MPNVFPGGLPVNAENARRFSEYWGKTVPDWPGMSAPEMLEAAERGELDVFYIAGGNFLETLPQPARIESALARVPVRTHQDLFLSGSMLVDPPKPDGAVLLLPAQTRYEQPGGGTLTSTERRIRFSPEIPGPRIGEARPEWDIFLRIAAEALGPEQAHLVACADAAALRAEMERTMPLYHGIGALKAEGESVQYGGPLLCAGGVCAGMPEGRARFSVLVPPPVEAERAATGADGAVFYLATRRGQQFNTMVWGDTDSLTGSRRRDEVFIAPQDAARLGLREGSPVRLVSGVGQMRAVCRLAPVAPGTLQVFWPEGNALIPSRLDPASREPDYNAWVRVEKL